LDTPKETWSDRPAGQADTAGWKVRVVPNLFPILDATTSDPTTFGRHEVIIERPDHHSDWQGLSLSHLTSIFRSYQNRLHSMNEDDRIAGSVLFKNHGTLAGASQFHAHAQVIGLPSIPPHLARAFATPTPTLEILTQRPEFLVHADSDLVIFCPPESLFPLEVWIGPREPNPFFTRATETQLQQVAQAAANLLASLSLMIEPLNFHFFIHSPSPRRPNVSLDRWMLKITPRLENLGGLEWASHIFINPLPADWCAQQYRQHWLSKSTR
jgi:UDPglucose--hexose-1-phosphate uridylyltransferase